MKKVATIMWIIIAIALSVIYFSYNITLSYDSCQYIYLSEMLSGKVSFANWEAVRSFVLPGIIWLSSVLFGKGTMALTIGTYAFYAILLAVMYLMYKNIIKEHPGNLIIKIIFIILAIALVPLNPIVLGFYHVILTEFVSMTLAVLMSYLAWRWVKTKDFEEHKVKYVGFLFAFMILTVISWHLKQTYILCSVVPLVIATLIAIIENHKFSNIFARLIVVALCAVALFGSIKIWNVILEKNNVTIKTGNSSQGLLGTTIIEGVSNYRTLSNEKYTKEYIVSNNKLSEEDRKTLVSIINKENPDYKSFILLKRLEGTETKEEIKPVYIKGEGVKVSDGIKFVIDTLKEEPKTVFDSYFANYLGIADFWKVRVNLGEDYYYYVERTFDKNQDLEINYLAYNTFRTGTSGLGVPEFWEEYAGAYVSDNKNIKPVNDYMLEVATPAKVVFKFTLLALPILWIVKLIKYFIIRKRYEEEFIQFNHLVFILYSYALASMVMHATLGALMDRYAISAYVCTIIAFLFDIYINVIMSRMYKIPKHLRNGKHGKDIEEEIEDTEEEEEETDKSQIAEEILEDLEIMNKEAEVLEKGNKDEDETK